MWKGIARVALTMMIAGSLTAAPLLHASADETSHTRIVVKQGFFHRIFRVGVGSLAAYTGYMVGTAATSAMMGGTTVLGVTATAAQIAAVATAPAWLPPAIVAGGAIVALIGARMVLRGLRGNTVIDVEHDVGSNVSRDADTRMASATLFGGMPGAGVGTSR